MTKSAGLLNLMLAAQLAQGGASAAEIFADDFNDNQRDNAKWAPAIVNGNAALQETAQQLQFSIATATTEDFAAWPWLAGAPMDIDWQATVRVHNASVPPSGGWSVVGMEIFDPANPGERLFIEGYAMDTAETFGLTYGYLTSLETDDTIFGDEDWAFAPTTAYLKIAFNAATKVLIASVNFSEPLNETQWTQLGSFGLGGSGGATANRNWNLTAGGHFALRIGGGGEATEVSAGQAWLDDFTLSVNTPPPLPEIAIVREGSSVRISWPAAASNFSLQSRPSAAPAAWTWEELEVTVNNGVASALAAIDGASRIYRLSTGGFAGMKLIPAGPFQMGDTFAEGRPNEVPVHTATLSAFYIDRKEVTKNLWDEVAAWGATHGYSISSVTAKGPDHPVCGLGWIDAVVWCNARSEMEGRPPAYFAAGFNGPFVVRSTSFVSPETMSVQWNGGYRLPTEAEWEKAARGGVPGKRFSFGDTISHTLANYESGSERLPYDLSPAGYNPSYAVGARPYTSPAGSFSPNAYGLYDMTGNVWEWCWDPAGTAYPAEAVTDPRGAAAGNYRIARGGSWDEDAWDARVAVRGFSTLDYRYRDSRFGFRCAISAP